MRVGRIENTTELTKTSCLIKLLKKKKKCLIFSSVLCSNK